MTLESSKNLGGVGAILMVIGFLSIFAYGPVGILGLIGIILVLVALKGLAGHYKEPGIFNNALYGFIATIVGIVVAFAILVMTIINAFATLGVTDWTEWAMEVQQNAADFTALWNLISPIVIGGIAALVVLFIFVVISAVFYRRSLDMLAPKTGVGMFGTAGLLILIGAVLTIIIIGFVIIWIAAILLAVAFFSIKSEAPQPPSAPQPPPPQQTS